MQSSSIGVFDSGVGGLSVVRAIWEQISGWPLIYFADQAHVPYGPRSMAEIRDFSAVITRYLISQGAVVIVVACNAASAAALHFLRQQFPAVPFVGMEPAVKPAAEQTQSRVVGVLATPATFQGELYATVVERFGRDVTLLQDTCPGLVAAIEAGQIDAPATRAILERALQPMLAQKIDTVVLGCTHYPFVIPLIRQIAGPGVRVIDPAPAIARQTRRVLERLWEQNGEKDPNLNSGRDRFLTTGDAAAFSQHLENLLGLHLPPGEPGAVEHIEWQQLIETA